MGKTTSEEKPDGHVDKKRRTSPTNDMQQILAAETIETLLKEAKPALTLNTGDTLDKAVEVLRKNHIHACPVFDFEGGPPGMFCGFLDVADIANYLVIFSPNPHSLEKPKLSNFVWAGTDFGDCSVRSVMDEFHRYGSPAYPSDTLLRLCEVFDEAHTPHAIVLESKSELKPRSVMSESDIVRFLAPRLPASVKDLPLATFKPRPRNVYRVSQDATVLVALQKLAVPQVSALAVVDEAGKIVGNFSASNLCSLFGGDYVRITDKVGAYLRTHHSQSMEPITATETDSLQTYLDLMVQHNIHHVWTVDETNTPINVCSTADVIGFVRHWAQPN